jgi:hypothetical protein
MNIKILFSAALISSLAFVSCKKELEPQADSIPMAATPNSPQMAQPVAQPIPRPVQQPMPVQVTQQAQTVAKGMNPPKGQPGHRYDIPIGAPLSTPIQMVKGTIVERPTPPAGQPATANTPITINSKGEVVGGSNNGKYRITTTTVPATAKSNVPPMLQAPPTDATPATTTAATINSKGEVTGGNGKFKVTTINNNAPPPTKTN